MFYDSLVGLWLKSLSGNVYSNKDFWGITNNKQTTVITDLSPNTIELRAIEDPMKLEVLESCILSDNCGPRN